MSKTLLRSLVGLVAFLLVLSAHAAASKALMTPDALTEQAPPKYSVKFETTQGSFVIDVTRDWAPQGADRFYNLVKNGFFDDVRFFRVVPSFVVQFGMSGDPALSKVWQQARIKDDPVKQSNKTGSITFAHAGPNTRTTQVFINLKDNGRLDEMGFPPFGVVSEGLDVVKKLYSGYGDAPPQGSGPNQNLIAEQGNVYLDQKFEKLDKLVKATISTPGAAQKAEQAPAKPTE